MSFEAHFYLLFKPIRKLLLKKLLEVYNDYLYHNGVRLSPVEVQTR